MILAIFAYLAGFALAWGSVAFHAPEPLWTMPALICPLAWIVGIVFRFPRLLGISLYAAVGLAAWAALSGAFLAGLGTVILALLAWDAAGMSFWLTKAKEVPNQVKLWQALLLRSLGVGLLGAGAALGFAQMKFSLPFWGLVGLLLALFGVLVFFLRAATCQRLSDRQ